MSLSRRRSKSRARSAGGHTPKPYIGSTPFELSPQPFVPPPLAPSTAPQSPVADSPPASSVGLPLGASSTTPPPEDPFGLGPGMANMSLGAPRSTAHYSAAGAYRSSYCGLYHNMSECEIINPCECSGNQDLTILVMPLPYLALCILRPPPALRH